MSVLGGSSVVSAITPPGTPAGRRGARVNFVPPGKPESVLLEEDSERRGVPPSRMMGARHASCVEKCGYPLQVQAVEDALWRNAAFTSQEYAPAGEVELVDRVCVRVDAEH